MTQLRHIMLSWELFPNARRFLQKKNRKFLHQSLKPLGPRPRGYKTLFMLNSAEHEIYPAHKCWHFRIY